MLMTMTVSFGSAASCDVVGELCGTERLTFHFLTSQGIGSESSRSKVRLDWKESCVLVLNHVQNTVEAGSVRSRDLERCCRGLKSWRKKGRYAKETRSMNQTDVQTERRRNGRQIIAVIRRVFGKVQRSRWSLMKVVKELPRFTSLSEKLV